MTERLRVDVVGDPSLCPPDPGVECRIARGDAQATDPPADLVIVDLDTAGERAEYEIRRAVDPARDVVVIAVSRDPALATSALAAGASDFALLPRDARWLDATVRRERDRRPRRAGAPATDPHRLVVDLPPSGLPFEEYEKRIVEHALARAGWNRSRAARELEISRPRLLRKIERHGLIEPTGESGPDPA